MNDRAKLLKKVQMYSFAVTDASLFLDTHPDCADALAYYNKYKKLWEEAKKQFEAAFGPLDIDSEQNNDRWAWVDGPFPWELSANC